MDKYQMSLQVQAIGHLKFTLNDAYGLAPTVVSNCKDADKAASIHATDINEVEIKVNDIDETAALSDGHIHAMCVGIEGSDRR